jgi:predicted Zn-dependent protease
MSELINLADKPIKNLLDKYKKEYAFFTLSIAKNKEEEFSDGRRFSLKIPQLQLSGLLEVLSEDSLRCGAFSTGVSSLNEMQIKKVLDGCEDDLHRVAIDLPEKKFFPEKDFMQKKIKKLSVPREIKEELRNASEIEDAKYQVIAGYELNELVSLSMDTNGREVLQWKPEFLAHVSVEITPDQKVRRIIGLMPKNNKEIRQIQELIKYLPDITLDSSIRSAKTFSDLSNALHKIALESKKDQVKIENGLHDIITPFSTWAHEIIGHPFEEEVRCERITKEQPLYHETPFFKEGERVSKNLSLIDNPGMKIKNKRLIGGFDYDDEMFKSEKKVLIDNGRITGRMLGSKFSDGKEVGNARFQAIGAIPIPRMSVTHVLPDKNGFKSLEEMCESCEKETVVTFKSIAEVNSFSAHFIVGSNNAGYEIELSPETYLYKKNRLFPVKNPHLFSSGIYQLLGKIELSNDKMMVYDVGKCSKANPGLWYGPDDVFSSQFTPMALIPFVQVRVFEK